MARSRAVPRAHPAMKIVVILLLFAVVASLFSGLFFVYKDKGDSQPRGDRAHHPHRALGRSSS